MKTCILQGSPRKHGNTAQLLAPFTEEMEKNGWDCGSIRLYDLRGLPALPEGLAHFRLPAGGQHAGNL